MEQRARDASVASRLPRENAPVLERDPAPCRPADDARTPLGILQLQQLAGNRATLRLIRGDGAGRNTSVSGATRSGPSSDADRPNVQREMKFEFQTGNTIWKSDGKAAEKLERKYGPDDFLITASSGVRLEAESHGVLEFETGWSRKWATLRDRIADAAAMTKAMNAAPKLKSGRHAFPFETSHLRTGTPSEMRRGKWKSRAGKEGRNELILKHRERLEVGITDATWKAGIQSSEGFLLRQYGSFLAEHEAPRYSLPAIAGAAEVLAQVNRTNLPARRLINLQNFLRIVINYIMRGAGGPESEKTGAFASVRGEASKQAFILMSRTSFASMYASLLNKAEKSLFKEIVDNDVLLHSMALNPESPLFVGGYGMKKHQTGPTVREWLVAIPRGKDLLSDSAGEDISDAMGRFPVETQAGKKDSELVKFETRNRPNNRPGFAFEVADKWVEYAERLFRSAVALRPRPSGKGQTGLK